LDLTHLDPLLISTMRSIIIFLPMLTSAVKVELHRKDHSFQTYAHHLTGLAMDPDSVRETSRFEKWSELYPSTEHLSARSLRSLQSESGQGEMTQKVPVFQGIGTHYTDAWVGSPTPQRQSVIVDTGSHYTAFPCTGCDSCGENYHTDKLFDVGASDSFHKYACNECDGSGHCKNDQCEFSQSYTEGSSWFAYQVSDKYVGERASRENEN